MNTCHHRCYVFNCKGGRKAAKNIGYLGFFKLPAVIKHQDLKTEELSTERRRLWLRKLRLSSFDDVNINKIKICSRHFYSGKPSKLFDVTNPDWLPNLNFVSSDCESGEASRDLPVSQSKDSKLKRYERRLNRSRKICATDLSVKEIPVSITYTPIEAFENPSEDCLSLSSGAVSGILPLGTREDDTPSISEDFGVVSLRNETDSLPNTNEVGSLSLYVEEIGPLSQKFQILSRDFGTQTDLVGKVEKQTQTGE